MNFIARIHNVRQGARFARVHENADVPAYRVLLIDHAKAHAWETSFEIGEHVLNGAATRLDAGRSMSVGAQRTCDTNGTGRRHAEMITPLAQPRQRSSAISDTISATRISEIPAAINAVCSARSISSPPIEVPIA